MPDQQPVQLPERGLQVVHDALAPVRAQLAWAVEALIPADPRGQFPSAHEAGVPTQWLPRALKARDDLLPLFVAALQDLPAETPSDPLATLRSALAPALFDLVGRLVAGAYFMNPDVTRTLAYPGQQALPYDPDYDEIMATVERVTALGPRYVPTPPQRPSAD